MEEQLFRLAKGTAVYGVGQTLNRLIGFLLLPIFTAYLAPLDFGIISILGFVSSLITPIFGLGLGVSTGIAYYNGNKEIKKCQTIWTVFIILCISSFILLFITLLFSRKISLLAFRTEEYYKFIIIWVISSVFNTIMIQPLMLRLQFEEKAKLYVILTTISTLITMSLNVLFVVTLKRGVQGWVESGIISSVLSFSLFFIVVVKQAKFAVDVKVGKELLRLGLPMVPSFVFLFIMQHSGRYILQRYHGLETVGIYTIGYNFGMVMVLIVGAFTTAWYPYFNSFVDKQEEAKSIFSKILTYYTLGLGTLTLLFFIFAKTIVILFTQSPFHEAHKVIGMVVLSLFFSGVFSVMLPGIYFAKEVKLITVVQFISCSIVLGLNFVLIPWLGMTGAAISMLAGFILMPILQYFINNYRKYLYISYEWNRISKFSFLFVSVVALNTTLQDKLTLSFYTVFVICIISIVTIFVWAIFSINERLYIKKLLRIRGNASVAI